MFWVAVTILSLASFLGASITACNTPVGIYFGTFVVAGVHFLFGELLSGRIVRSKQCVWFSLGAVLIWLLLISLEFYPPFQVWLEAMVLFLFAASIASLLCRAVGHPSELIVVLIAAAGADIISSISGPTAMAAEQLAVYYESPGEIAEPLVNHLMFRVPVWSSGVTIPVFSVTDWFFISFVYGCAVNLDLENEIKLHRFIPVSLPLTGVFWGVAAAQIAGVALPGILFISVTTVVGLLVRSREARRFSEEAKRGIIVVAGLFAVLITLLLIKWICA